MVGVALFGTIFSNLLQTTPAIPSRLGTLPPGSSAGMVEADPAALLQLPPAIHDAIVHAYAASLQPVFLVALPFALAAFGLAWLLEESSSPANGPGHRPRDAFGMPKSQSSMDELARALSVLMSREDRHGMYRRLASGLRSNQPGLRLAALPNQRRSDEDFG